MPGPKPAILLVEHDTPTRDLYARALSADYRVYARGDARDVLKLLLAEDIRALVLEPALPDDAGWALLATLDASGITRKVPVVVCSVCDARKRGTQLGAQTCLVKPVLPTTLREAVDRVVNGMGQPPT